EVSKTNIHWVNYVLGAIIELKHQGYAMQGFNAVITSNLPVGAGVSSSAALTSAVIFSLNQMFSLGVGRIA
ncbi:GHMP family kinase ATP-binding protein, partial [Proteus mirabilis]|uniref:GHMP family kinase ATP-binding protein n=1 Tax=Proteus mirabilis TaxID=584 RepID=UPI003F66A2D2